MIVKKGLIFIGLCAIFLFSISFISAGFFSDLLGGITGKVTATCTDSDGGLNYNSYGAVCVGTACYKDYCASSIQLKEIYCTTTTSASIKPYDCPGGCLNGACVTCIDYYDDADYDGYGNYSTKQCLLPGQAKSYQVSQAGDCNDANPNIKPGATEICSDNLDNNCDLKINEGCETTSDSPIIPVPSRSISGGDELTPGEGGGETPTCIPSCQNPDDICVGSIGGGEPDGCGGSCPTFIGIKNCNPPITPSENLFYCEDFGQGAMSYWNNGDPWGTANYDHCGDIVHVIEGVCETSGRSGWSNAIFCPLGCTTDSNGIGKCNPEPVPSSTKETPGAEGEAGNTSSDPCPGEQTACGFDSGTGQCTNCDLAGTNSNGIEDPLCGINIIKAYKYRCLNHKCRTTTLRKVINSCPLGCSYTPSGPFCFGCLPTGSIVGVLDQKKCCSEKYKYSKGILFWAQYTCT